MSDDKKSEKTSSRRNSLKALFVGGVALTTLPPRWQKPVVDSVLLPVHAQTSPQGGENGGGNGGDPRKCTYAATLDCDTGKGTVCTNGKQGCMNAEDLVVQVFRDGAKIGEPKKIKPAAPDKCRTFGVFDPDKAEPGQYHFTVTPKPDGKTETSNTCVVKDDEDPPEDPKKCTYTATLDCESGKGKVCTAGDSNCENAKGLEIRAYKDGSLFKGPKAISPADPGKCREFKVFDPDKAEPGQYHFTVTPTGGSAVTSNTCTVEEKEPPEEECKGEKKIEGSDIGKAPQTITLGDYEFKITGWTEKGDSPGEYVGFTLDKPACFAVKSGPNTKNDCGTSWVNPDGTSGPDAKGISNITFKCPPSD